MTKEEEILEEIERFYKELYTSTSSFENTQFISYIENLQLPRLEDSANSELEGDITLKECKDILSTFSRGKSPGEDGFTWEFYNCFFDLLGQDLVDSFNASYRAGEMAPSQRRGVITLIPKEDSDLSSLANRPRSIYQYSSMAPRLSGKNCKFFKFLLSSNSQKRLRYKENNTKYRSLTRKPRSHVRILIYRTWPIGAR